MVDTKKVLGTDWYSSKDGDIGIVLYKDRGVFKAKIKVVRLHKLTIHDMSEEDICNDYENDVQDVLKWGSIFPVEAAFLLMLNARNHQEELKAAIEKLKH